MTNLLIILLFRYCQILSQLSTDLAILRETKCYFMEKQAKVKIQFLHLKDPGFIISCLKTEMQQEFCLHYIVNKGKNLVE